MLDSRNNANNSNLVSENQKAHSLMKIWCQDPSDLDDEIPSLKIHGEKNNRYQ